MLKGASFCIALKFTHIIKSKVRGTNCIDHCEGSHLWMGRNY